MEHIYYDLSYSLSVSSEGSAPELFEKTSSQRPFSFITQMGMVLDKFEQEILQIEEGGSFDFTIACADAYGEYLEEHVCELDRSLFYRNGKFDDEHVFPGAVLPMVNEDGMRLEGIVKEIKPDTIVMDFNYLLAGKDLHFKGKVLTRRMATEQEIQEQLQFTHACHCGEGGCHCHGEEGKGECHCHGEEGKGECHCHGEEGKGECHCHGDEGKGECHCHGEGKECCKNK